MEENLGICPEPVASIVNFIGSCRCDHQVNEILSEIQEEYFDSLTRKLEVLSVGTFSRDVLSVGPRLKFFRAERTSFNYYGDTLNEFGNCILLWT